MDKKEQFYTPEELAKILKLNIITIYRYIRSKKLKAYKLGNHYRVEKKKFQSFLNKIIIK